MSKMSDMVKGWTDRPNQELIGCFNCHFTSRTKKYRLMPNDRVKPCFFSGNIEERGKIVTISLNPHYEPRRTKQEQKGKNFREWYAHCQSRFNNYGRYQKVHRVFKFLLRVIADSDVDRMSDKEKIDCLQNNLVNLDWCPYYSQKFPTLVMEKLPEKLRKLIENTWDKNLKHLITKVRPRYIFVHGKPLAHWVERNTTGIEDSIQLMNSRRQPCEFQCHRYNDSTETRLFYLTHFINAVNKKKTLAMIRRVIDWVLSKRSLETGDIDRYIAGLQEGQESL